MNNRIAYLSFVCILLSSFFVACGDSSSASDSDESEYDSVANTLKDLRDGHVYRTVKIGGYIWMAENLNFKAAGSFCYNDDEKKCAEYGRLYTWAAAMDSVGAFSAEGEGCGNGTECNSRALVRGVCPKGWYLPAMSVWASLVNSLGGRYEAGEALKSASGWDDRNGTDEYSFSVLPVGVKRYDGLYVSEGKSASFWTSSQIDEEYASSVDFSSNYSYVYDDLQHKYYGYSVRCVSLPRE